VDFADLADFAAPNNFGALTGAFVGVALVAHLCGDLVFRSGGAKLAGFPDGTDERFLHVDVLAALHAPDRRSGVHVVRDGDDNRVNIICFLVEHLPEVAVAMRVGKTLESWLGAAIIDVAKDGDIFGRGGCRDVTGALSAGADRGKVELVVGGLIAQHFEIDGTAEAARGNRAGQQRSEEKVPSRNTH